MNVTQKEPKGGKVILSKRGVRKSLGLKGLVAGRVGGEGGKFEIG